MALLLLQPHLSPAQSYTLSSRCDHILRVPCPPLDLCLCLVSCSSLDLKLSDKQHSWPTDLSRLQVGHLHWLPYLSGP